MTRKELIELIESENTGDIFDPYDCCYKGALSLVESIEDDLLPESYHVIDREPVLKWGNIEIRFTTRNSFKYTNAMGESSKRHSFGFKLDEKYVNEIKSHMEKKKISEDRVKTFYNYFKDKKEL